MSAAMICAGGARMRFSTGAGGPFADLPAPRGARLAGREAVRPVARAGTDAVAGVGTDPVTRAVADLPARPVADPGASAVARIPAPPMGRRPATLATSPSRRLPAPRLALVVAALALAGCAGFPRGAGLEREILAVPADEAGEPVTPAEAGFAVEPVTRDRLAAYARWPAVGEDGLPWITRTRQPQTRIIAPGDRLAITIWDTETNGLLTSPGQRFVALPPTQVSSSGTVFLPYLGEVHVAGMAPGTARERIEEQLLSVTPSAQVQLEMEEGRQNTVSLVGGTAAPGTYPMPDNDYTLLELLADGGGISPALGNPQLRLQRDGTLYGIAASRLLEDPSLDTTLEGGDRVFAQADDRSFLSLGAAGSEARHVFPQERVTALDALAIIGGLSDSRADARAILILRRYPEAAVRSDGTGPRHARTVFTLDLTSADGLFSAGQFLIRPGDLVYVTESPLLGTRDLFSLVGSIFGLASQVQN